MDAAGYATERQLDDIQRTLKSCGPPTSQDDVGTTMKTLYYSKSHAWLTFAKSGQGWRWDFAGDSRTKVVLSNIEISSRMPCLQQIAVASRTLELSAAQDTSGSDVALLSTGALILFFLLGWFSISYYIKKDAPALKRSANASVRCPGCKSTQVLTQRRGLSFWTGMFGGKNIDTMCLYCGKRFKPSAGT
jgi:hypothetical protein